MALKAELGHIETPERYHRRMTYAEVKEACEEDERQWLRETQGQASKRGE
ncbi:hypothetical protein [Chlorobium phaeovibrioides]|uniref:Uncharacterized protein n=1 Tax=Chlorobium phaeovibrioides TaxID=1094 RepID=A0ABW9URD5_CHLPH|nr:hypothetical protein [Chlorobium phaeovibrioides]MDT9547623.1 hypothetical protein [Chlorobium phaeovibrioides]MWV55092.1 hypothetical protein [Chlorobium phaeovibrioides]NQU46933.1 hypothetical protein [Chlorobium sp.]